MPYTVEGIKVFQRDSPSPALPHAQYSGLKPETLVLPRGHRKDPSRKAFRADTILERDIEVITRNGHILRTDVYRPTETVSTEQVPVLLAWSPYGKCGTGVLRSNTACPITQPCPSAVFVLFWHSYEGGRNGYDVIECLAKLPWCIGGISLVGNSWLAIAQWFIAAERPPHLTCIAPLEGSSDIYRESLCRGGVPYKAFWGYLQDCLLVCLHKAEDIVGMLDKYSFQNPYWADKRADMTKINIPAYVLASYSTALHTVGFFRGFVEIPHDNKWQVLWPVLGFLQTEWYDLYSKERVEDLQLFFDRYLKGKKEQLGKDPCARLSTLGFNKLSSLFISHSPYNRLINTPSSKEAALSYKSDVPDMQVDAQVEELSFEYTFKERSYLIGFPRAVLYMSTKDSNDMDVFVCLRKADSMGNVLRNINIPLKDLEMKADEVPLVNSLVYIGPSGILRASHRKIDQEKSKPHWPFHPHDEKQLLEPGQIVKLKIGLWSAGIVFNAGEKLILRIAGHHMVSAEFEPLHGAFQTDNKGRHNVHVGPQY
ncbi:related to cocaine esterase [Fusarium oxysporum]|uniref:Related to cocaine esterase n=1 Tax=Fusarium oxysporum TaxID=5507 RepID=A0A2H3SQ08_FUSOX|nr:related to cocaine esterase [Fusarium oxysporum]